MVKMINQTFFLKGSQSEFVLRYPFMNEFNVKKQGISDAARLQNEIAAKVRKCPNSLFIFDEVDKLDRKILDSITPFLEYDAETRGLDYRYERSLR